MRSLFALFLAAFVLSFPVIAATGDPLELQTRFNHYHAAYLINADGTAVESHEWSKTVLKEQALEWSKKASVSYSTSAQQAEVVAAYTLKADGKRIDVPKDNYQVEVNSGKGKDSPVYSDWSTLTVVFPDVALGDKVVFSYKLTQTEPMFPGHYSTVHYFGDQIAHDDVRIRFDYPAAMWVQHEARGMQESLNESRGERKVVEWTYTNPAPVKSERRDYSVFDSDKIAGVSFSTFRTYADIAAAYGTRALPKAAVSERVNKLAAEIVKDKTAPRAQARALYEWVATNITYAGNCIGIGAVVPRDLDFVLDNKMGDCKDHATLLQALLAARDIRSTQALVNAGSAYRLAKVPVVSTVNHVINYLPAFDLFVDATSDSTPFGMLPFGDQDKPVLLVEGYKDGTRTPVPPASSDKQHVKSKFRIADNGTVSGNIEVFLNGIQAAGTREWARNLSKNVEDDMIKDMYRSQGMIGSGKFVKDDPTELTDHYHYKADYTVEKFIKMPGAGAFYIYSPLGIATPIHSYIQGELDPEKEADVTCSGGSVIEEYTIELPKKLKVLSVPENMKVANAFASYSATYKLKGNILTVKRVLDDRTKGNVCSPQISIEYQKLAEKIVDNLKEQVLYK